MSTYKQLKSGIAEKTGVQASIVDKVLKALGDAIAEAIANGEYIAVPNVLSVSPQNKSGVVYKFGKTRVCKPKHRLTGKIKLSSSLLAKANEG